MKDDVRALLSALSDSRGTAAEHRKTARALLAADDKDKRLSALGRYCDNDTNGIDIDEQDD